MSESSRDEASSGLPVHDETPSVIGEVSRRHQPTSQINTPPTLKQ